MLQNISKYGHVFSALATNWLYQTGGYNITTYSQTSNDRMLSLCEGDKSHTIHLKTLRVHTHQFRVM